MLLAFTYLINIFTIVIPFLIDLFDISSIYSGLSSLNLRFPMEPRELLERISIYLENVPIEDIHKSVILEVSRFIQPPDNLKKIRDALISYLQLRTSLANVTRDQIIATIVAIDSISKSDISKLNKSWKEKEVWWASTPVFYAFRDLAYSIKIHDWRKFISSDSVINLGFSENPRMDLSSYINTYSIIYSEFNNIEIKEWNIPLPENDEIFCWKYSNLFLLILNDAYNNPHFSFSDYSRDVKSLRETFKLLSNSQDRLDLFDNDPRFGLLLWIHDALNEKRRGKKLKKKVAAWFKDSFELILNEELSNFSEFYGYERRLCGTARKQEYPVIPPSSNPTIIKKESTKKEETKNTGLRVKFDSLYNDITDPSSISENEKVYGVEFSIDSSNLDTIANNMGKPIKLFEEPPLILPDNLIKKDSTKYIDPHSDITNKILDDSLLSKPKLNTIAERNTISIVDPNRIFPVTLYNYFAYLYSKSEKCFIYCLLCLITGINWKRLTKLIIGNSERTSIEEGIHFNTLTNVLSYEIYNGATDFNKDKDKIPGNNLMKLVLPDYISTYLSKHVPANPNEPYHFDNAGEESELLAKYYSRKHSGTSPTPERLNATFESTFASHGLTEIEYSYIRGNIPPRYQGQIPYIRGDLTEINRSYRRCYGQFFSYLNQFGSDNELGIILSKHIFSKNPPNGNIGSMLADEIDSLKGFIFKIRALFSKSRKAVKKATGHQDLTTWMFTLNLQHLYLYILEQLYLGIRPVGNSINIYCCNNGFGCLIDDKASSEFLELTYSHYATTLSKQINACNKDISMFLHYLEDNDINYIDNDDRRERSVLARYFTNKNNTMVSSDVMGSGDFESLVSYYDLGDYLTRQAEKSNYFRHIMSTELHRLIPDIAASEFLGHQRSGIELFSYWSTSNPVILDKVLESVESILSPLKLNILRIK